MLLSPTAERREGTGSSGSSGLWLERLYARAGLPFWVGAIAIGFAPFLVSLIAAYAVAGLLSVYAVGDLILPTPFYFLQSMLAQFGARQAQSRIEALRTYAQSMSADTTQPVLAPLHSMRGVLVAWAGLTGTIIPTFFFSVLGETTPLQAALSVAPFFYFSLILATFVWVWGYSMVRIYRMGKVPMQLKPFTEDRTLGLRPFGSASLRLTGLYVAFAALFTVPTVLSGFVSLPFLVLMVALFVPGFAIFLLPLASVRRKLLEAKRAELSWVNPRYTKIMKQVRAQSDRAIDPSLAAELTAVKELQRDAQQIHTWPFDIAIVVRLAAIILSVVAILVSRIVQTIAGL